MMRASSSLLPDVATFINNSINISQNKQTHPKHFNFRILYLYARVVVSRGRKASDAHVETWAPCFPIRAAHRRFAPFIGSNLCKWWGVHILQASCHSRSSWLGQIKSNLFSANPTLTNFCHRSPRIPTVPGN